MNDHEPLEVTLNIPYVPVPPPLKDMASPSASLAVKVPIILLFSVEEVSSIVPKVELEVNVGAVSGLTTIGP